MKYKDNGQWKEIYIKALDSMPVGTEIDFDGQASDIPVGWEQVDDVPVYSATETVCGTWIDGKPLYRKVLNITSIEATSGNATRYYTIDTNANNFNIINLYGNGINNTDGNLLPLGYVNYNRTSNIVYRIENHQFAIQTPYTLNNVNVFIEYTKTTD